MRSRFNQFSLSDLCSYVLPPFVLPHARLLALAGRGVLMRVCGGIRLCVERP